MNRRNFFGSLATMAATLALDPEKLLWVPGQRKIFIPAAPKIELSNLDMINKMTLKYIRDAGLVDMVFAMNPLFYGTDVFRRSH